MWYYQSAEIVAKDALQNLFLLKSPVLIQPNLRFLHELLGWEIQVMKERKDRGKEHQASEWMSRYTWPALCRDIVSHDLIGRKAGIKTIEG